MFSWNRLHGAAERRQEREVLLRFSCAFQLGDLLLGYIPQPQSLLGRLDQACRRLPCVFASRLVAHPQKLDQFALAREQIRAVNRQERRVFLNDLARRGDVQLLNVAVHARDELPAPRLVRNDETDRPNRAVKRLTLSGCVGNADLLLALDRHDELLARRALGCAGKGRTVRGMSCVSALHAGRARHVFHSTPALRRFGSRRSLWLRFTAGFLHHRNEIHAANRAFARRFCVDRRMHRAGVVVDVRRLG